MSQPAPSIAAIIPAFNAAALLPACIGAIRASTVPVREIILFDDGSTDDTGAVAASLGARVIRNEGKPLGPGVGRNRSANETACDLVLFVDSDVVIHPDAIGRLCEAFDDPAVVAAFGSYDDRPPSPRLAAQYANLRHHFIHQQGPADATTFWAGLGMARRDAFIAAGGFDSRFGLPSIEDIELGSRLIARGGAIRLVPQALATHLKDWKLLQLWRTDIFCRAIPWSRLIASGRSSGAGLNGAASERLSAVLAYLILIGLAALAFTSWGLPLMMMAGIAYLAQNRRFFGLLGSRLGGIRMIGAIALHWVYHLYASATFATILLATRIGRRRMPVSRSAA